MSRRAYVLLVLAGVLSAFPYTRLTSHWVDVLLMAAECEGR
jgi:hypothetical protein